MLSSKLHLSNDHIRAMFFASIPPALILKKAVSSLFKFEAASAPDLVVFFKKPLFPQLIAVVQA